MTNNQKLIIAQRELINHQDSGYPLYDFVYRNKWYKKQQKLKKHIRRLEEEIMEEENKG